jgi:hypothetical protein
MSWFKRKPAPKNPPEHIARRNSPTVERLLKETKEATKPTRIPKEPKK